MMQQDRALACGSRPADLLEQVAEGGAVVRTLHQRTCAFCQAALAQLEPAWETVQRLRAEEVAPPPTLVARVMRRIRADRERWRVDLPQERGVTRIPNHVLATIAYEAVRAVRGVASVHQARPRRPNGPATDQVQFDVELGIAFGFNAPAVAEAVRGVVIGRVRELTGLTVATVHVTVTDVEKR